MARKPIASTRNVSSISIPKPIQPMATNASANPMDTNIITDKKTLARVAFVKRVDSEGGSKLETSRKVMSEADANEVLKDHKESAKRHASPYQNVVIEIVQPFGFDHVFSYPSALSLFGEENEGELWKQLNSAIDVKLNTRARSLLLATDDEGKPTFEPQDAVISLREYIGEPSAMRGRSETEKIATRFDKMTDDEQEALLQLLLQKKQTQAAA